MTDTTPDTGLAGAIVVVPGKFGWRNNRDEATDSQLELYCSGGRWERVQLRDRKVSGHSLVAALETEGAREGANLVVIAANRFAQPVEREALLRMIEAVAPDLLLPAVVQPEATPDTDDEVERIVPEVGEALVGAVLGTVDGGIVSGDLPADEVASLLRDPGARVAVRAVLAARRSAGEA